MPFLPLLFAFGGGATAGVFGGLFASNAANSLAHSLMWLVVIAVIAFIFYTQVM